MTLQTIVQTIVLKNYGSMASCNRHIAKIEKTVKERFGADAHLVANKVDEGAYQVELVAVFCKEIVLFDLV